MKRSPSYLEGLVLKARELRLFEKRHWHLLLHYKPRFFGGYKSEADGEKFFVAPDGKKNPESELSATIRSFFDEKPMKDGEQHSQCRFPARFRWLDERLAFDRSKLTIHECSRLEKWKKAIRPQGMTMIFASYYANNPATMFGHTLIRFDKKGDDASHDLLDYAVNYAANTGEDAGLFYAVLGLTGGYPGVFSTYPYYFKVQQYGNFHSRDIWEYELNTTPEAVDLVLNHLWELGQTFFRYYFVDENCSYHLLALLELANPGKDYRTPLHLFVAPSDTIKVLAADKNLIREIRYRPSKLSRFKQRLALMSRGEMSLLRGLVKEEGTSVKDYFPSDIAEERKAFLADTAIEYLSYKNKKPNKTAYQRTLLAQRSELGEGPPIPNEPMSTPPHLGHKSMRWGLGGGYGSEESFASAKFRLAYHDLLSDHEGYSPDSEIEAIRGEFRYYIDRRDAHLEEFVPINVVSLFPFEPFIRKISWNVSFGWDTLRALPCGRCGTTFLQGGPGIALQSRLFKREVYYLFGNALVQISPWSSLDYRLGPQARGGFLVDIHRRWKLNVEASYDYSPLGSPAVNYGGKVQQRISLSRNFEIRLSAEKFKRGQEATLSTLLYF